MMQGIILDECVAVRSKFNFMRLGDGLERERAEDGSANDDEHT